LGDAGFIGDEEMSREGAMGFSGMTKWKLEVIELFWDIGDRFRWSRKS
jgi:hypothetical protein